MRKKSAVFFMAGFLAVLLIAGVSFFAVLKIYPAGDNTLLIIDSIHQYLPFYAEL